jgi:YegS/Rv2252/BmrU family lipid kinase
MGSAGKQWDEIRSHARDLIGPFGHIMTQQAGEAGLMTRKALSRGAETIIGVGGDGTLNEILNGFITQEGQLFKKASLGYIPIGTGCDLVKTLHIPKSTRKALELIRKGYVKLLDVGRIRFMDHRGEPVCRFFHNIASFGLGGEVDERVNRTTKAFGGFISFFWSLVISVLLYQKKRIHLVIDDSFDMQVSVWNIAVANGQYHGGGMWVAPDAVMDDGLFQVTVIGDLSLPEVFLNLPKLYNGTLFSLKKVQTLSGRHVEARSESRVLLDVDGEQPGRLPASIDVIPRILPFVTAEETGPGQEIVGAS